MYHTLVKMISPISSSYQKGKNIRIKSGISIEEQRWRKRDREREIEREGGGREREREKEKSRKAEKRCNISRMVQEDGR